MTYLALIAVVTAVLWLMWRVLALTFDAIDQWQAAKREEER